MKKQLLVLSLAGLVTALNFAGQGDDQRFTVGKPTPPGQIAGILGGAGVGLYGAYKFSMPRSSTLAGLPRPVRYVGAAAALTAGTALMMKADYNNPVLFTNTRIPWAVQQSPELARLSPSDKAIDHCTARLQGFFYSDSTRYCDAFTKCKQEYALQRVSPQAAIDGMRHSTLSKQAWMARAESAKYAAQQMQAKRREEKEQRVAEQIIFLRNPQAAIEGWLINTKNKVADFFKKN